MASVPRQMHPGTEGVRPGMYPRRRDVRRPIQGSVLRPLMRVWPVRQGRHVAGEEGQR